MLLCFDFIVKAHSASRVPAYPMITVLLLLCVLKMQKQEAELASLRTPSQVLFFELGQ